MQTGAVDVQTFSKNSITNLTQYDLEGNPIAITDLIIEPENKEYVEWTKDELLLYSKMPHSIRPKRKIKSKQMKIDKKSEREVLEEFEILNSLFDSKNLAKSESEVTEKILSIVDLTDNSYQDLWENLVGDFKSTQKDTEQKRKNQGGII